MLGRIARGALWAAMLDAMRIRHALTAAVALLASLCAAGPAEAAEEAAIAPLGFTAADVTDALRQRYGLALGLGVVVTATEPGVATDPPLAEGDQLLEAGGQAVRDAAALSARAATLEPGETLALGGLRDGRSFAATATAPRSAGDPAPELTSDPLPVIDSGGHAALIREVILRGDRLYSAGEDKTIRVWSLARKRVEKTLRSPAAPGAMGKIHAIALSPDGRVLAAAGTLNGGTDAAGTDAQEEWARLIDVDSGETLGLLRGGHQAAIWDLAFSPDGARLISGGADGVAVIWDLATRQVRQRLEGHGDQVRGVAFTPDGARAVTASYDGLLRLWDADGGGLIQPMVGHGDGVYALAVAPDGTIASGDNSGEIRLWDGASGADQGVLARQGDVGALAFSPDGARLLATCGAGSCGFAQRVYDVATKAELRRFEQHQNIVVAAAWGEGDQVATGGGADNEIQLWSAASGEIAATFRGAGRILWGVGWSQDGRRLGWGASYENGTNHPAEAQQRLDAALALGAPDAPEGARLMDGPRALAAEDAVGFERAILLQNRRRLRHAPSADGRYPDGVLKIEDPSGLRAAVARGEAEGLRHTAYSFTRDGRGVISGGAQGALALYDLNGRPLGRFVGHQGDVWAVAPSPDGRLLASAGDDQTVRLWNLETFELIATIFPGQDGSWIAVAPQGYYDSSENGAERIGWLLNYGPDKTPGFIAARQLGGQLYRPGLIARAIALGSAKAAILEANADREDLEEAAALSVHPSALIAGAAPPEIRLLGEATDAQGYARLVYAVRRFDPLKGALKVVLDPQKDGDDPRSLPAARLKPSARDRAAYGPRLAAGERLMILRLPLRGGYNDLRIRASNAASESAEDLQLIHLPGEGALELRGKLRVLAIGVDNYGLASTYGDLRFAGADARAFAQETAQRLGRFYQGDPEVMVIAGGDGPRPSGAAIREGFRWMAQAGPNDTTLLFFAGHGRAEGDDYFFLPTDYAHPKDAPTGSGALPFVEIWRALGQTPGRKAVFVDACRSAGAYGERMERAAEEANAGLFLSASRHQLAKEDPTYGHGLFTYALLTGLRGEAFQGGTLSALRLSYHVTETVRALSEERQTPPPFRYSRIDMRLAG